MMITIKNVLKRLIILVCLTPVLSSAQNASLAIGTVEEVRSNSVLIGESLYKILPTAKIYLANKKEGSLENIKRGDYVRADLLKFNRVNQIEAIYIYDDPEQLFKNLPGN